MIEYNDEIIEIHGASYPIFSILNVRNKTASEIIKEIPLDDVTKLALSILYQDIGLVKEIVFEIIQQYAALPSYMFIGNVVHYCGPGAQFAQINHIYLLNYMHIFEQIDVIDLGELGARTTIVNHITNKHVTW